MPMNPRLLRPLARRQAPAPAPSDPYFSSVSLLLHFDGDFTDSSTNGRTLTAVGDAAISTTEKKFGSAALSLQEGQLVSDSYDDFADMSSGDWTLEAWVWRPSGIGNATIFNLSKASGQVEGLHFWVGADNKLRWDEGTQECATGGDVPLEQWCHVAAVRSGGTATIYVGGASAGNSTTPPQSGPYKIIIGAYNSSPLGFTSAMLIDDLRITVGAARYTANFTPPTAPFPNQ